MKIAYFCNNFYTQVNRVVVESFVIAEIMKKFVHKILFIVIKPPKDYPLDPKKLPYEIIMKRRIKAYFYPYFYIYIPFSFNTIGKLKNG